MNSFCTRTRNVRLPYLIMENFKNLQPDQIYLSAGLNKMTIWWKVSKGYEQPEVDATVVDGAAMLQMNTTKTVKTFAEYN